MMPYEQLDAFKVCQELTLARGMNLLTAETHRELDGLRGRATFYVTKLLLSLAESPPGPESAQP